MRFVPKFGLQVNNANQLVVFYDYAPECNPTTHVCNASKSGTGVGGCSFKLAVVDPAAMLTMGAGESGVTLG